MMEKKVRRLFWAWEFDKEEKWLNEMAQEGWLLDGVGLCTYRFAACEPGEYTVRLEMHPFDQKYIDFMKETGAQYVGRCMQWMYFRKKAADANCVRRLLRAIYLRRLDPPFLLQQPVQKSQKILLRFRQRAIVPVAVVVGVLGHLIVGGVAVAYPPQIP